MRTRVYVSYSRSVLPGVAALCTDLVDLGQQVWLDREFPGGGRWWERVLSNIDRCDLFVIALSRDSMSSVICRDEVALAGGLGIPMIPVLVDDDVTDSFLPPSIGEVQRVDHRNADRGAMAGFIRALQSMNLATATDRAKAPAEVPKGFEHDVGALLRSNENLEPVLQLDLFDQLRRTIDNGLHTTRGLATAPTVPPLRRDDGQGGRVDRPTAREEFADLTR